MFAQAAVGIVIADLNGSFLEANYKFCSIVGFPLDELRERTLGQLTHADDRPATEEHMRRLLAGDIASYEAESRFVHSNGRLAAVVESSDDAIISTTLDGIITTWNSGAQRMFVYSASEVIGKSIMLLIPPGLQGDEPAILTRLHAADPLRLSQVVTNLLTNAAKFTDPHGTIRLQAFADGETVTISVSDTGVGLTAERLSAVFTMFSQVDSAQDRSETPPAASPSFSRWKATR